jgi:myo-inositol-1(or 4)-monophosphatase
MEFILQGDQARKPMSTAIPLNSKYLGQLEKAALEAAGAGGAVLNRYFLEKVPNFQRLKGRNDLVTAADLESCRGIKRVLKRQFPDHSFLFEEAEYTDLRESDYLWIVDPLDGTTFHNRGLPFYSLVISLQFRGTTILAVTLAPHSGNCFVSRHGGGSRQINRRLRISRSLRVSSVSLLDEAVIGYSYGKSERHARQMGAVMRRLLPSCRFLLCVGGADIGFLAGGKFDAFIDNSSTAWDFAGLVLMIQEAGGQATDWKGDPWQLDSTSILLTNGKLHNDLLEILRNKH